LLSEQSLSSEVGIHHRATLGNINVDHSLTAYRMWVDNWIIWLPRGNFWSPDNIREVQNTGIEYSYKISQTLRNWILSWEGNYAYTKATNQTAISNLDRSKGNQLPYTPLHKVQGMLSMEKEVYRVFINSIYTGSQFTETDNSTVLPAFFLLDSGIDYKWKLKSVGQGRIGFQVNNLLNADYQVLRLRAMPGRNYQFNFQIQL
jgi:vitamin B12 transporter